MKQCKICNQHKELVEFAKNKQQKDGHNVYCKPCMSEKYSNAWYQLNKESHNANEKLRRRQNHDVFKKRAAEYYKKNKKRIIEKQTKYQSNKYKTDPLYAMKITLAATIGSAIRYKGLDWANAKPRTQELIGCTYPELMICLESKFESWMSWENRGRYDGTPNYGWDIDHIKPLALATTLEELIELCHYTNLQPLCSYQNRNVKKNNIL